MTPEESDQRMPHEIEREAGNAAYLARHGNSPTLKTEPPLSGAKLAKKQARWRRSRGYTT